MIFWPRKFALENFKIDLENFCFTIEIKAIMKLFIFLEFIQKISISKQAEYDIACGVAS